MGYLPKCLKLNLKVKHVDLCTKCIKLSNGKRSHVTLNLLPKSNQTFLVSSNSPRHDTNEVNFRSLLLSNTMTWLLVMLLYKMIHHYWDLLFGLYPSSLCFLTTFLPSSSGEAYNLYISPDDKTYRL
jgi:hypothetical protein